LRRCLDSIPKREDLEVIIVDDASDGAKVDFEKFPGLGEPRTTVIFTKEGRGAGYARNVGLERARGEWLLFADADDFYNYCFGAFLDEHVGDEAEVVYFKCSSLHSETYINTERGQVLNDIVDLFLRNNNETLMRYASHCPWNMLVRKTLVDTYQIRFDETLVANDVTFAYMVGLHASKVNADERAVYCVTLREDSLSAKDDSAAKRLARVYVIGKVLMSWRKQNLHIRFFYDEMLNSSLMHLYLKDKPTYAQARATLLDLGYTPSQIRRCLVKGVWNAVMNRFVKRPLKALCPYGLLWLRRRPFLKS
jgi:glycosyltransferase involved in cell wall biosynthesis